MQRILRFSVVNLREEENLDKQV